MRKRGGRQGGREGGREGGGQASIFLVNKIKRKQLFYTQVRSCGRVLQRCVRDRDREKRKVNWYMQEDHLHQTQSRRALE